MRVFEAALNLNGSCIPASVSSTPCRNRSLHLHPGPFSYFGLFSNYLQAARGGQMRQHAYARICALARRCLQKIARDAAARRHTLDRAAFSPFLYLTLLLLLLRLLVLGDCFCCCYHRDDLRLNTSPTCRESRRRLEHHRRAPPTRSSSSSSSSSSLCCCYSQAAQFAAANKGKGYLANWKKGGDTIQADREGSLEFFKSWGK